MRVVLCDHKNAELLETLTEIIEGRGHTVLPIIDDDPVDVYNTICGLAETPHIIITDLAKEPDDLNLPVDRWWGTRLIDLLRNNQILRTIRIIPRSRFISPDDLAYLNRYGITAIDIFSPYNIKIIDFLKIIGL